MQPRCALTIKYGAGEPAPISKKVGKTVSFLKELGNRFTAKTVLTTEGITHLEMAKEDRAEAVWGKSQPQKTEDEREEIETQTKQEMARKTESEAGKDEDIMIDLSVINEYRIKVEPNGQKVKVTSMSSEEKEITEEGQLAKAKEGEKNAL